ncbi:hypothetical protein C1Y08_16125 [Pseudomonas sp. FW306-02-F02-AA]|uniref:Toxin VasX N-terminal region domain-containing protein n=1 Tax=Pseudomonas fluorescens TaxID=294 RepID=A0A0N9W5X4_PSEFL|nr:MULTISPECIES: T6SS effector BTH_I2691 family protein [unclassified Pseudomonas]ALI01906.1 hypothetical protein AO353_12735 [Pseudomonas fluorescens]PMZ05385.1 hypothetical protein C1Y07_05435 [Pseudomonas sp. FW306-02-F02-AB]PMZ09290.1 hypothetical protein C1Y06_15375 [Pseudomonas sp. FW306-02-H06C]PMZ15002.1 hypothetical protein C1Y08_16125 [Pseudomonas sp. FW306-02-F02-AA]PMZ20189.1 hypothetical protein C1Y09_20360 [Pseudomonas sp. FW306-02-F08-AA]
MTQPATEAQLKQARRNQEFTNTPMGKGQCPLMQGEVAIFPVRYALDESPIKKGSSQGPHPLPKNWSSKPPELKTRSYTLRQLRDGWLYVWNSIDKTFHEYQIKAEQFTRHKWTDSQLNKDVRNNPGETHPYLLYPRRSQLRIAYSPVQWTWRMCELMRNSATEQTQWMRKIDLPAFCGSGKVAHGDAITELGKSVADILVSGKKASTFTSTLLPTKATDAGAPFKPAFEEALVRGKVPAQDTALFVALDDPLAMVDDLNMNLIGRLMEQSQFEALHQHKLQSAFAVQNLCGFDADPFIPPSIKDPIQRQAYTDDLYTLLKTNDEVERGKDLVPADQAGMVEMGATSTVAAAETPFKAKWGQLPDQNKWKKALEEWNAKRFWREDVRFDEVQKYLSQTTTEAQRLHDHCQRSERDLITWLDQLSPSAEAVYHDTCNEDQASLLLETAHAIYTALGNGENGQKWLCKQARQPSTLFSLALFNFNPEVATLIKKVTHNFSTTGKLDDQGSEGDGSSPALAPTSSGDATNIGTRTGEIKAIFDLEVVKNSKLYKAMSSAAKQAMTTLVKVANNQARDAWHGLSTLLLPAMKQQAALTLAAPQVLISTEISSATQLTFNPTYQRDYQAWLLEVVTVKNKITGDKGVLRRPGAAYDQRSARLSLQSHEEHLKNLLLKRPNQIVAKASGSTRLRIGIPQINSWLADLGQTEVMAQLKIAGTQEYLTRTQAWMGQNLGNALPALVVGLNLWNVYSSAKQAQNDGKFSADEWRTVGANAAYAANAIAALWVGPAWSRAGEMSTQLGRRTLTLAQAGYTEWSDAIAARKTGESAIAHEFAAASKGLIWRTVTWAALGVMATGLEAWQLSNDIDGATSEEEKNALKWKFRIVAGMSIVATGQLVGAGLGSWFSFAWVMSTPVTIMVAVLGVAYLMITMAANRYKREGLRLWLYRCSWGRGATPEWLGDEGHPKQMQALLESLQRPSVVGRALYYGGGSTPRKCLGFWVQVQVPNGLAGKEVTLQPAMIEKNYFSKDELQTTKSSFYGQFLNGNWVDPKLLGQLPNGAGSKTSPADFSYTSTEQHRLWQVWIDTSTDSPILELEVKYPAGVLQRTDGRGYMFRLALEWAASEADRANNAFSGELKDDIVLAQKSTQLLKLAVPN